jgi:uncharacterized paraquat-inducible protein A
MTGTHSVGPLDGQRKLKDGNDGVLFPLRDRMGWRRWLGVGLVVLAFCMLVPGVHLPMLSIEASVSVMGLNLELMNQTRSILQTVSILYSRGSGLVASLILLFSVVVPAVKALCLLLRLLHLSGAMDAVLRRIINVISKWSMADVFVMGIWVAFLSAQATAQLSATLHSGFYFFLGYCLLSIAALYCLDP